MSDTVGPAEDVVGRKIVEVRPMTPEEAAEEGWHFGRHGPPAVLVLDDGTKLYPSRDPEGNGPGCLFGRNADGTGVVIA